MSDKRKGAPERNREQPKEKTGHSRIRESLQIAGLVIGGLAAYGFRDRLGLKGFSLYAVVALAALACGFLLSYLYVVIFGKPQAAEPAKGTRQGDTVDSESVFRTVRETAESIVIALVLAFLFRAFEAEAFVIPTGSMAPTLMGRHKDMVCETVNGVDYRTGASIENEDNVSPGLVLTTHDPYYRYPTRVEYEFDKRDIGWKVTDPDLRSFNGDRIIVSKFAFEFSDPSRWDVIVFKYPGNPKQNYIKRLIGLPGETIRIHHGDILLVEHLFSTDAGLADDLNQGELHVKLRALLEKHGAQLSDRIVVEKGDERLLQGQDLEAEWRIHDPLSNEAYFCRKFEGKEDLDVYSVHIARKPPQKLRAMLQRVDDTRYVPDSLIENDWPTRWQPWQPPGVSFENPWKTLDGGRCFEITAPQGNDEDQPVAWLRYRHIIPSLLDWAAIELSRPLEDFDVPSWIDSRPPSERAGQLIPDYYAYNDALSVNALSLNQFGGPNQVADSPDPTHMGLHWVGDLALEAEVTVESDEGYLWLQLVEGGRFFRCRIDLSDGEATLSITDKRSGEEKPAPFTVGGEARGATELVADTRVHGPGTYRLRLANCDDQLVLWVNDWVQHFRPKDGGPKVEATYANDFNCRPTYSQEEPGDLMPAGIGSQGASVKLKTVRVLRDIYYIADISPSATEPLKDYVGFFHPNDIQRMLWNPEQWETTDLFAKRGAAEFSLKEDQFFPLGDNSPQSKDGRLWDDARPLNKRRYYVDRRYLTGKALFIYWPHSWDTPIPLFPNFGRMGYVR